MSDEEVAHFQRRVVATVRYLQDRGDITKEEAKFERLFPGQIQLQHYRGALCYGVEIDGEIVSFHATRFSKTPRKDAWGRYVNFHLAYTLPGYRFRGYATTLVREVTRIAVTAQYDRLRSLVQSWGGFRLHYALGHQFWGLTDKGELVVDTPLTGEQFPTGVPRRVRYATEHPEEMSRSRLLQVLTDENGLFRRSLNEAFDVTTSR